MKKFIYLSLSAFLLTGCVSSTPQTKPVKEVKERQNKIKKLKKTPVKQVKKEIPKKKIVKKTTIMHHAKKNMKMFQSVDKKDAILLQKGPNKESCAICGMNLVKFYKTSHAAKVADHNVQYCSIHCLSDHIRQGAELENPMVVDVKTLKFIPVTQAYYVVGSNVRGTMSRVSKYAFKNLSDAKEFQKKHGGEIMDFYSAWQVAKKDFKK
jgi:nitrous oxide reductase accessory protein NosL